MYKTGVIGDRDSVLGFMAIGFSVFEVNTAEDAAAALKKAAADNFAVIFVIEDFAKLIEDEIDRYKASPVPAVIIIPGKNGSTGYGMDNIKKSIERAVGADII